MQPPVTEGISLERVGAAEVDRRSGRRVDEEQSGHGVDRRVDAASCQRQAVIVAARGHELQPRSRLHLDLADMADRDQRARRVVGLQPVADAQAARRRQPRVAEQRASREHGHIPRRLRLDRAGDNHKGEHRGHRERNPVPVPAPLEPGFDSRPQVARWLDTSGQAADRPQQLVLVHPASFSRNNCRARNN